MQGVLAGFATIAVLIALGMVLAQLRIVDAAGQRTLSALAFFVASPALLVTVLQESDLAAVFSGNLVTFAAAVVASAVPTAVVAWLRGRRLGDAVVMLQCASYQNAGNLGLPIAAYVLGDPALVAPVLLLQLLVLQPLVLALLDADRSRRRLSLLAVLARPLRNPITIGSVVGLLLAVSGTRLPQAVEDPLTLVAGMAVPSMLIAYGVALRLGPLPGRGVPPGELGLVVAMKMLVQPLAAYAVGRFLVGLDAESLLAVTVLSALPTAQNVFVIATRYDRSTLLARDAIFVSTLASVPVIAVVAALLA